MFNDLISKATEYLMIGNTYKAKELMKQAEKLALGEREHVLIHDLGNAIQREIFNQYLERGETNA